MAVTANWGQADHRCGNSFPATVTEITRRAESGMNRTMSSRQFCGSRFVMIGMTNITAMMVVMAPAVCLMIAPMANAIRPTSVTNSALPMMARSTFGSDSVALAPVLDSSAWPRKNAMKEVTSETTSATAVNTMALAAYTTPRRGCAVSEVRIIPVEYSEVIASAPSTAMMSWPNSKKAMSDACVASIPALFCGLLWMLLAMPKPAMAATPTLTMNSAAIVQ